MKNINSVFRSKGFDIKWVDGTHALGIFSSHISGELVINGLMAFENCLFESRKHKNFPAAFLIILYYTVLLLRYFIFCIEASANLKTMRVDHTCTICSAQIFIERYV